MAAKRSPSYIYIYRTSITDQRHGINTQESGNIQTNYHSVIYIFSPRSVTTTINPCNLGQNYKVLLPAAVESPTTFSFPTKTCLGRLMYMCTFWTTGPIIKLSGNNIVRCVWLMMHQLHSHPKCNLLTDNLFSHGLQIQLR